MAEPSRNLLQRLRQAAWSLRREALAMYLAMRHPETPWYARLLAAGVVIYALSPLDLIPDPVPVLGLLDDLVVVPLGVLAVRWLIPPDVLAQCRRQAAEGVQVGRAWLWAGAIAIVLCWLLCAAWIVWWLIGLAH